MLSTTALAAISLLRLLLGVLDGSCHLEEGTYDEPSGGFLMSASILPLQRLGQLSTTIYDFGAVDLFVEVKGGS